MPAILGGSQLLCSLIWIGVGLAVPALVASGRLPPLGDPDAASPSFLLGFVPPLLAGVVFAGILAAIMSTADSLVNIASAALVRDIPRALGRKPQRELLLGRLATPVIALAAGVFAWLYGDLIALLGTFAFGTFAAALGPALVVGLNWRGVSSRAAAASIATGLFGNPGLELLSRQVGLGWLAPGVLPSAVSLAASFTVLFGVSFLDRHREEALPDDVEAVMSM
jgi:sodium/proline symporter/sodium/pantothenate symporter